MSIESLRYDLQETLRYQLPDKTWEYLARRYVGLYLKRKIGFKQLAEEAKSLLELSGESAPPGPLVSFGPVQARPRAVRQEVISDILAKNAETDSGNSFHHLVAFRKRFLGGKLISFDRVEEWVKAQSEEDGEPSIWLKIPVPDSHIVTGPKDFGIDPPWSISSLENTPFELSRTVLQYAIPKSEYVQNSANRCQWSS